MGAKQIYFYTDKPLFGLDIGHGSLKVMQLETLDRTASIAGYGSVNFDIHALNDGVIANPKIIATAMRGLFQKGLVGHITTNRVAMALPGYRTFTRSIRFPTLNSDELREAVKLEVEQYVPMQLQDLYMDYTVTMQTPQSSEVFVVAVPKRIVDSYLALANLLELETVLIEPTMAAGARLFSKDKNSGMASVLIDFGSLTASISIFNKTILATSTVPAGGLVFTEAIRNKLQVSQEEAGFIKTKYGLDSSMVQKQVTEALAPAMEKLVTEIRRMLRYYQEHYGTTSPVSQVVMMGGGANMPGLGSYLTEMLKMPVRTHNHPWAIFEHKGLKPPVEADRLMYATVAGLSLLEPKEVFVE